MLDPGATTNDPGDDFFAGLVDAWESAEVKPRVLICPFPHNPTSACVDLAFMTRLVEFALEHDLIVCHDFAYADLGFDGYKPPSILQVPRAKECCVELYTLTKSFSMAGWRVGFLVGNAEIVAALDQVEELPRLRHVPAGPDRGHRGDERSDGLPRATARDLPVAPRHVDRGTEPNRLGRTAPRGSMFIWAPMPEPYLEMGSLEFARVPHRVGRRGDQSRRRLRRGR